MTKNIFIRKLSAETRQILSLSILIDFKHIFLLSSKHTKQNSGEHYSSDKHWSNRMWNSAERRQYRGVRQQGKDRSRVPVTSYGARAGGPSTRSPLRPPCGHCSATSYIVVHCPAFRAFFTQSNGCALLYSWPNSPIENTQDTKIGCQLFTALKRLSNYNVEYLWTYSSALY